jgi:putative N6-adenine-specific DNA methylase
MTEGFDACLRSRIAVRVLCKLAEIDSPTGDALYEGVRALDWAPWITPKHTLAVRAATKQSALTHTQFIAQRTKDAIVDRMRDELGARSSVDLEDPDLLLFVHVVKDRATVYLDLSGEALHRRGWRGGGGEAPLKETLAAAILRLSGWNRDTPLADPMCGSGTIPIEAALWSREVAPGLLRKRFGFERWPSHDDTARRAVADLRDAARARMRKDGPAIFGSDVDARALDRARVAMQNAGVEIELSQAGVAHLRPLSPPGWIVTNPPYGERLAGTAEVYAEMGAAFRRMRGHTIAALAGAPEIERAIPLRPIASHPLFNGPIECRLLVYRP